MRILVTGGGGFLGFAIVKILLERGDDVVVLCRGHYGSRRYRRFIDRTQSR